MSRIRLDPKSGLVAVLIVIASLFAGTSGADAASTYVKNNHGNYVGACGAIGCPYGPGYLVKDGTSFTMVCWKDGPWKNGNYNSNRWFRGRVPGISGQVWIHSSYVYNQTRVGRC